MEKLHWHVVQDSEPEEREDHGILLVTSCFV